MAIRLLKRLELVERGEVPASDPAELMRSILLGETPLYEPEQEDD